MDGMEFLLKYFSTFWSPLVRRQGRFPVKRKKKKKSIFVGNFRHGPPTKGIIHSVLVNKVLSLFFKRPKERKKKKKIIATKSGRSEWAEVQITFYE